MKKILSLIIAFAMIMSMSSVALAVGMDAGAFLNAIDAAAAGSGKYALTEDVSITGPGNYTIDLKGVEIDSQDHSIIIKNDADVTVTGGGSISGSGYIFKLGEKNTADTGATLTIESGVSVSSDTYACVVLFSDSTLNTLGTLSAVGGYAPVLNSGSDAAANTTINVEGGSITHHKDLAIYNPGNGVVNVSGGTITGAAGIEMRRGTLNVNGGTITATGDYDAPKYNNGGSTVTSGVAVAVSEHLTNDKISVNITGGTLNATGTGGKALYAYDVMKPGEGGYITPKIEGGTFNAPVEVDNLDNLDDAARAGFISGGIFSDKSAEQYIVAGAPYYIDDNGNLVMGVKPYSSGISVKYNGGNSFSTSKSDVPTGVEIDGVPVAFSGNGSSFTVSGIPADAKWVTVRWNSTSVTTNFTPSGAYVAEVNIPKTGDMPIWAAVAAFFGF